MCYLLWEKFLEVLECCITKYTNGGHVNQTVLSWKLCSQFTDSSCIFRDIIITLCHDLIVPFTRSGIRFEGSLIKD